MPALRPFQVKLDQDIEAAWASGARNVMPVAATGSGKTVVLSKKLLDEQGSSAAIAHRQELVSQISVALARNGVRHRLIGAKKGSPLVRVISSLQVADLGQSFFDPNARCGVGGVDTIVRMSPADDPWFAQVRLLVQDEGHHVLKENKWGKAAGMFPNARGLFPTATPCRADRKGLGRHADGLVDALVMAPTMRDIINMGYLTDYRIIAAQNPELEAMLQHVDVSAATGDFNADQMRKAVKAAHMTGDVVKTYLKYAAGKLGVTFASDVEEATKIAQAFRDAGVPAEVVSAKTPDSLRAAILARFRNREILQLVNVDLFGEGFDLPAIEVVSFARPTQSFPLYAQQFGRALRLMLSPELLQGYDLLSDAGRRERIARSGKPKAIIIDHVNNVVRHMGPPDAAWRAATFSLDRGEVGGGGKSEAAPYRVCLNPTCMQPYERYFKSCPHCGFYPEPAARSAPEFVDGDLTELDADTLARMRGEAAKVLGEFIVPRGMPWEKVGIVKRGHEIRRENVRNLQNSIAWWAGLQHAQGLNESQSYRKFYLKFGVDVATCLTLDSEKSKDLKARIDQKLIQYNIDPTADAMAHFSKAQNQ